MAKSDEALMLQLQTGDLRSFDTLVKRWEKPLLNYCYRMVNDTALAEDLRQEVFLRIYRSAKRYRATAQFSTWLYRIAKNLCLDNLAKKGHQNEIPMGTYFELGYRGFDGKFIDLSDTSEAIVIRKEIQNQIHLAMEQLPEDLWGVVTMRHYHDMKFREIAEILECPISTVKSRMISGMARLRQILSRQE